MRRSSFNGLWVFLFIFIFMGGLGEVLPMFFIMGLVFWIMSKTLGQVNRNQTGSFRSRSSARRTTRTRQTSGSTTDFTAHGASRADLARVNVYLRKYFRSNHMIDMPNHLSLALRDPAYKSLYSLDVYRDNVKLGTLAEFRTRYGDLYAQMFDTLLSMAINDQSEEAPVVDAEFTTAQQTPVKEAPKEEHRALAYAEQLNDLNADIPDEEITNGLYESIALLKQIDKMEQKFPDSRNKLEKLYQYYLPIQVRILKQYTNLQNIRSDANYESTYGNLKKTINLVNQAMEQLIGSMSDSDFINLSADMSALEAVLQKDGLAKDMNMNRNSGITLELPKEEKKEA